MQVVGEVLVDRDPAARQPQPERLVGERIDLRAVALEAELEDTVGVMGEDFHPFGLERNRAQIDAFADEAYRLGLTSRRVTVDEYFADYLQGG